MTEAQLGWIGGIMDGEGYIGLRREHQRSHDYYSPLVTVTNTRLLMLTHLRQLTKLGLTSQSTHRPNFKHRQGFVWALRVKEQKELLPIILPYLVVKREQAELLIEYLNLPLGHNTHGVSNDLASTRAAIFSELAELNHKGPTQF